MFKVRTGRALIMCHFEELNDEESGCDQHNPLYPVQVSADSTPDECSVLKMREDSFVIRRFKILKIRT